MIMYKSTRGSDIQKDAAEAIIQGIAEDSGLYVPEMVPKLPFDIETVVNEPYKFFAYEIIKSFFGYKHAAAGIVGINY